LTRAAPLLIIPRCMAEANLKELIESAQWFHAIDYGDGLISPGRFEHRLPPNYTLFGVFELLRQLQLSGATVVDVGTMDGLVAFMMARLGAAHVIATDLAPRSTFEAGRQALALAVDYRVPLSASALPEALNERADVIVLAGVLYHVFDPLAVLEACRRALKQGGWLIVETSYLFDEGAARMSFSPADFGARGIGRPNVFWRPSRSALQGMLQLVGFDPVASIAVDGRLAMLGQALRPEEIPHRSRCMREFHARYMKYENYRERIDLDSLANDSGAVSGVSYSGPRGASRLYPALYQPEVPLQPAWRPRRALDRYAKVARSAWFHARAAFGDASASLRHTGSGWSSWPR
jgi:2-polyprenyl-3-methyl-5-hydroxy-6-metoxy-1,4-benzoquinol methylase